MLEKLNGFQIFISTINIRNPLSIFLPVIQIQHGCNCIHTKSVYVIILNPHQRTSDQEVLDLILSVIKDFGSPVRMLSFARVCIFISCSTIELCQSMRIFWKMRRYPVKNHANLVLMAFVDQMCKILRCSITGSRCIISRYLISPGTIVWILGNPHQLNVGIPHLPDIRNQCLCQIAVGIKSIIVPPRMAHPGTRMYLINCQRLLIYFLFGKFFSGTHPFAIRPEEIGNIRDNGSCLRPQLCIICIRVCFVQLSSVLRYNQELVHAANLDARYKQFVYAHRLRCHTFHLVGSFIPSIKFPNHVYTVRMRCPDIEAYSLFSFNCHFVSTHFAINIIMCCLSKQVTIHLCKITHKYPPCLLLSILLEILFR